MPSPLPVEVSAALAHALVAEIATIANTRILFLKGPVSNAHGLRPWRAFHDVDVLADPARVHTVERGMEAAGWQRRPSSLGHSRFVTHSHTYFHPQWPCDVDIHTSFPGILLEDSEAFDVLWTQRMDLRIAGRNITTTNFAASALITALHSLRAMSEVRHSTEFDYVVKAVTDRMFPEEIREELLPLAIQLNAVEPLRPFLARVGAPLPPPAPISPELERWKLHSHQKNQAGNWMLLISQAPARQKPGLLWRAVFPTTQDLLIDHPEAGESWPRLISARVTRLGRGIRALPRAYTHFRSAKETALHTHASAGDSPDVPTATEPTITPGRPDEAASSFPHEYDMATDDSLDDRADPGDNAPRIYRSETCAYETAQDEQSVGLLRLVSPFTQLPLALEGTSCELWKMLEHPYSVDRLATHAATRYGAPLNTVRTDVGTFVDQMVDQGFLTIR
ncbi:hypothetical protein GCM10022198_22800 [Klugiella xanthotipulae]|uniref:Coenzyme PQQ synthesis protein D (PqqD) n=1 Tax=Klugiella xanthotipulae TaxID=244735 RepID=A0A543HYG9_9MICO|nr:PqqD family peptide modification chaperone [Klugiella xanthotipulae]TQM63320.1 coenzyme PQQ synthesis protein D (PqqD) [Klugiella xanthotipulae]